MGQHQRLSWFSPARRLASLPPGPAGPLVLATFIDWSGTGVWLTTSTVLLVRVVHLAPTQVGFGLTAGGLLGLASVWPVTNAARRWPVRRVAMTVQVLRGLFALSFLAVHSAETYYLAAALVAIVDRPSTSVNQVLVSRYVPAEQRTSTLAVMHVATNAGMTIGALFASVALVLPSRASLDAVVLANSLSFYVAAWQVRRASAGHGAAEPAKPGTLADTASAKWLNWRYLLVTLGCAALALLFPLFNVEIPLWLTTRTTVPPVTVSVLFMLNTVLVVVFQARLTRWATSIRNGARAAAVAGMCILCCCGVLAALPGLITWAAAAGFGLAALLLTLGEMNAGSAAWTLSFGLSPPDDTTRSLAFFNTGQAAAFVLGPALCTSAVAWAGRGGFAILAAIVAAGAVAVSLGARGQSSLPAGFPSHRCRRAADGLLDDRVETTHPKIDWRQLAAASALALPGADAQIDDPRPFGNRVSDRSVNVVVEIHALRLWRLVRPGVEEEPGIAPRQSKRVADHAAIQERAVQPRLVGSETGDKRPEDCLFGSLVSPLSIAFDQIAAQCHHVPPHVVKSAALSADACGRQAPPFSGHLGAPVHRQRRQVVVEAAADGQPGAERQRDRPESPLGEHPRKRRVGSYVREGDRLHRMLLRPGKHAIDQRRGQSRCRPAAGGYEAIKPRVEHGKVGEPALDGRHRSAQATAGRDAVRGKLPYLRVSEQRLIQIDHLACGHAVDNSGLKSAASTLLGGQEGKPLASEPS
jgi:MFS family permease